MNFQKRNLENRDVAQNVVKCMDNNNNKKEYIAHL